MSEALATSSSFLDPDPEQWLTSGRIERLRSALGGSIDFLTLSGLLRRAVDYWVRLETAEECLLNYEAWPIQSQKEELDRLEAAWLKKNSLVEFGLHSNQLRRKLSVPQAGLRWARFHWQHRVETWYLDRKSMMDCASCLLLRVQDKFLALELYHRIKADEISFEEAVFQYGLGPERSKGGHLSFQTLESMPFGLAPLLRPLSVGELTMPFRIGKVFALVRLDRFEKAILDSEMEQRLLQEEYERWIAATSTRARLYISTSS